MSKAISELELRVTAETAKLQKQLNAVDAKLNKIQGGVGKTGKGFNKLGAFSKGLGGIGAQMGMLGGATAGAALAFHELADGISKAIELETQVRNIGSLGVENFERFGDIALEMSERIPQSAVNIAEGVYQAISAGVDSEAAASFVETAGRAAVAGLSDTKTAVDALSTAVNAFAAQGLTAKRAGDILFQTVKKGKTTFPELAGSLSLAASQAAAMDVSFESMNAAVATATKQGVPTAQAFTQVSSALSALQNPTKEMEVLFGKLGAASGKDLVKKYGSLQGALVALRKATNDDDAALFKAMRRKEAFNLTLELTGQNAQMAADDMDAMTNSVGSMTAAFDINSDSMANRLTLLDNKWDAFKIRIGEAVMPILENLVEALDGIVTSISGIVEAFENMDIGSLAEGAFGLFSGAVEWSTAGLVDLEDMLGITNETVKETATDVDVTGDSFNMLGDVAVETGDKIVTSTKKAGKAVKTLADIIDDAFARGEAGIVRRRLFGEAGAFGMVEELKLISASLESDLVPALIKTIEVKGELAPGGEDDAMNALTDSFGNLAKSIGGSFGAIATSGMKDVLKNVLNVLINFAEAELAVASAAAIFRSVFGDFSSLVQLGLGIAALETARGFVNSFAVGTDFVQRDQLAMVHRGEQIVPADQNTSGGGEGTANSRVGIQTREVRGDVALTGQTFRTVKDSQMFETAQGVQ